MRRAEFRKEPVTTRALVRPVGRTSAAAPLPVRPQICCGAKPHPNQRLRFRKRRRIDVRAIADQKGPRCDGVGRAGQFVDVRAGQLQVQNDATWRRLPGFAQIGDRFHRAQRQSVRLRRADDAAREDQVVAKQ